MEKQMNSSSSKLSKAYSCVRCFKRKVKCDKHYPCDVCLGAKVDCIFRIPTTPRPRRSKVSDEALIARLKYYEDLLNENGIKFNSSPASAGRDTNRGLVHPQSDSSRFPLTINATNSNKASRSPEPPPHSLQPPTKGFSQGKLITDHGKALFIENTLWTAVSEESRDSKDLIPESESEDDIDTLDTENTDFVLGLTSSPYQAYNLHPTPEQILKLWQIFLNNVNPLIKIVHKPTLQNSIESIADIENVPRALECLMFAIYGAAIMSMRDGECHATFGESRSTLQSRYNLGVRISLNRARFMGSSDIMVLQAFVIYLLTVRQHLDSRTLWTLSSIATRIAQGMGLHRDGSFLGVPPFETEMRRRIWLQVNLVHVHATELCGLAVTTEENKWNTKLPLNINDVDIWPDMKEPPLEKTGATEMIICLLRCEIRILWKTKLSFKGATGSDLAQAVLQWVETATMSEKEAFIREYESSLEEKFLKYCDPSEPLHLMASIMGRTMCQSKSLQVRVHRTRHHTQAEDISDSERQFWWETSMSLIEADNAAHSYRSLQRFNWHTDANFQWHALMYILGELIARPVGNGKDDAWAIIEDVFKNHPNFISDHKRPLHIAIASLCLKAWQSRHTAQIQNPQGSSWLETPLFLVQLQQQRENEDKMVIERNEKSKLGLRNQFQDCSVVQPPPAEMSVTQKGWDKQLPSNSSFDPSLLTNFFMPAMEDTSINWQTWESLLNDVEMPPILTSESKNSF